MRYPLTQKRFSHRRQLVYSRAPSARSRVRQSTLTQLDFVSTPPVEHDASHDSYSDDAFEEERPTKRVKINRSSSRKQKDKTLTQIGFVAATGESDDEIVHDSQYEAQAVPSSEATAAEADARLPSGPLPIAHVRATYVLSTPVTSRRAEAPSSQTPASIALSSIHKVRSAQPRSSSPLRAKSSKRRTPTTRMLTRTTTVADSDDEDIDLVHAAQDGHNSFPGGTLFHTQAQFTYDPADAALDRDAARAAWTQALIRKSTIDDSMSDDEEDLLETAEPSSPPVFAAEQQGEEPSLPPRPSQVSTVDPTQCSPPPLVFTSASTTRQLRDGAIVVESSPLPAPPWSDSDAAAWQSLEKDKDTGMHQQTLSDFSLPPPPCLFGSSSPMFSLHRSSG